MSFSGKVVIVIGASSGIGAAAAILFSKEGANVVMVGRNEAKLSNVAEQCKKYTKPFIIKADITNEDEAASVVAKVIEKYKKLDILVNSAGIICHGSILQGNMLESYDEVMKTNLRAIVHLTTLAAPYLMKTKGNIVNISSVAASSAAKLVTMNAYYVSKAAVNQFTRCAALELAAYGVRVNSVSPGPVKTELLENTAGDNATLENYKKLTALKKLSEVDEVAEVILFLSSDKAHSITGSDYVIDNGYLLNN